MVQWNGINLHRYGRHHIGRFLIHDKIVQCLDIDLLIANDVCGYEFAASIFVKCLYSRILYARILADDTLDLLQLDAEATNLDLAIAASNKLDVTRREVAHNISCAVNPGVFLFGGKGIVDIDFGSLLRPIQVTTTHLRTRNPEFACRTDWQAVALVIDDIEAHVIQRLANRNFLHFLVHKIGCGENGTFGRSISIVKMEALWRSERGKFLATRREMQ